MLKCLDIQQTTLRFGLIQDTAAIQIHTSIHNFGRR